MKQFFLVFMILLSGCMQPIEKTKGIAVLPKQTFDSNDYVIEEPEPDRLDQMIENMTLEEKVGQMFLVRANENSAVQIEHYHIGGVLFFGKDFDTTRESITQRIQDYQNLSEIGLFMGVDEEGGTVNRISNYKEFRAVPFYSPQALYTEGGFDLIRSDTVEKCELLRSLGINLNLAPVADIASHEDDYIYPRTFSLDPTFTGYYVSEIVRIMNEEQIGSVLKHFPGYGNNVDTHEEIAIDTRSLEEFENRDWIPFQAGIHEGADMVLMSHTIVEAIDDFPISLSLQAHEILREVLGFEGVIITDDLIMSGITKAYTPEQAAVLAVQAGNDMMIVSEAEVQIQAVIDAIRSGTISEDKINTSVKRILKLKSELNLLS